MSLCTMILVSYALHFISGVSMHGIFMVYHVLPFSQATVVMSVLDSLSTHAPDEEYLGQRHQAKWTADTNAMAAASRFSKRIEEIERVIDARNADMRLKNRTGAGVLPYELLRPTSDSGVTGRGVPNSISI